MRGEPGFTEGIQNGLGDLADGGVRQELGAKSQRVQKAPCSKLRDEWQLWFTSPLVFQKCAFGSVSRLRITQGLWHEDIIGLAAFRFLTQASKTNSI